MGWRPWRREDRAEPNGGRERLPDTTVLAIVAQGLTEVSGEPWRVAGACVEGPGTAAVVLGDDHPGSPGHFDLVYLIDRNRPQETAVPDCVTGHGPTSEAKARSGVTAWATTTAVTLLELTAGNGAFATHMTGSSPDGIPGWHVIHGGIIGLGSGTDRAAVQEWAADHPLLPALADVLTADTLPRDRLIGVKMFFGSRAGHETAEVRVHGQVHDQATRALRALPWPRQAADAAYARTFVLLVHPERPA
ncbi:DUF6348 family protein [Actinacidiphila soli]|uniref:DUF6348 family protein n=1 Tax=Actinacidiphila soli TaxID=2487275 RepID=UPI000FCB8032|nr:DUF6348 family protein [Actinacidiphila soli]